MNRGLLALCVLASCAREQPETWAPTVVTDKGRVCLYADANEREQVFAVGAPLTVKYQNENECRSSSCTKARSTSCAIFRRLPIDRGGVIHTSASWMSLQNFGAACTNDCLVPEATCQTAPLVEGAHVFWFGGQQLRIVVPGRLAAAPCLESS